MECLAPFGAEADISWKMDGNLIRGRAATSVLPIKKSFSLESEIDKNQEKNIKRNNSVSE